MASAFIAMAYLVGFAWGLAALATGLAMIAYMLLWAVLPDHLKYLARQVAWGIWFGLVTFLLFRVAVVKAFSLSGLLWPSLIFGGIVVAVMGGLGFVIIHSRHRAWRIASLASTALAMALVCFMPYGDHFRTGSAVAQADEGKAEFALALYAAALKGDLVALGTLVSRGADVNSYAFGLLTPLYGAVVERQLDAAALLLGFGADVNAPSGPAQRTPLHEAVLNGDVPMIELLLKRGADVAATTTHGRTPLAYAVNPPFPLTKPENSEEIAAILREAGGR